MHVGILLYMRSSGLSSGLNRGSHSLKPSRINMCTKYPDDRNGQQDGPGEKTNEKDIRRCVLH
jgi:hypothetical protein